MIGLLGKKLGQTRVYDEDGRPGAGDRGTGRTQPRLAGQDARGEGRLQRGPTGL